jgi:hyperosmotically inducible periplasmic protein
MKLFNTASSIRLAVAMAATMACSDQSKAPDITKEVRNALDEAGLNSVSVNEDRKQNVVTLSGNVASADDKTRAESVAKSVAGSIVVANEIGVRPSGDESTAKKVDSELDSGIEKNLEAMLVQHRLSKEVNYEVSNGVVTLKGDVHSQSQRTSVEKLAKGVPNVKQVVNELEVRHQKATTTESRSLM